MINENEDRKHIKVLHYEKNTNLIHLVKVGETIEQIAKQYNQTKEVLMEMNQIKQTVEAGDRLFIPQKNRAIYVVKPLDTLQKIARRYGVSEQEICTLNDIKQIFIGQILLI
jgi:LysM repeat protein